MVEIEDAIRIYKHLLGNNIQVWLTGGWGIDALLGMHTRPHKDIDVILKLDDVLPLQKLLNDEGYLLKELWSENICVTDSNGNKTATAFVLQNNQEREIDIHAIRFDKFGNGIPTWIDDEGIIFKKEDLSGNGMINGFPVKCISPQMQVLLHTGYRLPEKQMQDLRLLYEKFGVKHPDLDF